jgi:anti-anti-sigma regulatory factor
MNIKTSTKEKFTVITVTDAILSANMTADIDKLTEFVGQPIPHVVLSLLEVKEIAPAVCHKLAEVQQAFYDKDCSFVVCNIQPSVEAVLEQEELMEIMNITPTESEAWDIVQMEEIERELMNDFED